jgi:hypothetical protein
VKLPQIDSDRLAWQPSDISFTDEAPAQKGTGMTSGLFSDFSTERQRLVDEKMATWFPELVIEKADAERHFRYSHGWIKLDPGTGKPAEDIAAVQAHHAEDRGVAMSTQLAEPGSHGHAEELRGLANEADLHQQRNYASLRSSHEGTASLEQTAIGGGRDRGAIPDSSAAHALNRAADMIDRKQPSLARLHSGTIRDAAAKEAKGDPAYAARLSAAADKLDLLKPGQGLAAAPPETGEFQSRTEAARRYARGLRQKMEQLDELIAKADPFHATPGSPQGGQFAPSSGGGSGSSTASASQAKKPAAKPKPKAKPPAKKPGVPPEEAHEKHELHQIHQQIAALEGQLRSLEAQKVTLSATATGKKPKAPKKAPTGVKKPPKKAATSTAAASGKKKTTAKKPSAASSKKAQLAQVTSQISQVQSQISSLQQQASSLAAK